MQAEQLNQRKQQLGDFVRGNLFPMVIGGSLIVLGVLMVVGSFAFSWVEVDEVFGDDTFTLSAMTIWTGGSDDVKTLNTEANDDGGFSAVRLLDRTLILLPLGALTLIGLAGAYIFLMKNLPWLTPMRALVGMAGISCFLLLFTLIWESLSNNNWRNSEGGSIALALADYSTLEQQILGFLAFLITMTGLVLYMLSEQSALGTPQASMPAQPRPPQARPTPPRPGQPEPSIPSPQPPAPPSQSS